MRKNGFRFILLFVLFMPIFYFQGLDQGNSWVSDGKTRDSRKLSFQNPNKELWDPVEKAVQKQQYQKALDETKRILKESRSQKNIEEWTRGLIRQALLEQGLHGYETAVREFRQEKWPEDSIAQTLLRLFYAQTIRNYYYAYRWEIDQREKVISKKEVDLKKVGSNDHF